MKRIGLAVNPNDLNALKKRRYQPQTIQVEDIKSQKEAPEVTSVIEGIELLLHVYFNYI